MQYVEVVYLKNKQFERRKIVHDASAASLYFRAIAKLSAEKTSALIMLREENHQLIKSEMVSF